MLDLRFRFGVTTKMKSGALGRFALWPYRFSSWPAVRLRTTDVVAISKTDILLPCSLAPIHLYILPFLRECAPLLCLSVLHPCPRVFSVCLPKSFLFILNLPVNKFAYKVQGQCLEQSDIVRFSSSVFSLLLIVLYYECFFSFFFFK